MKLVRPLANQVLPFAALATLFLGLYFVSLTSAFLNAPEVFESAIVIDVAVIIPLLYFLLIRKRNISNLTVIPVFIGGIVLASILLPKENQTLLSIIKTWIIPVVEIGVVTFIFLKVWRIVHHYRTTKQVVPDFFTAFKSAAAEVLPKQIANVLAMEIAVIYYGFFHWKKKERAVNEFSYHKNTGTKTLLYGMIIVIAAETIGFHFMLSSWSATAAWIATGISIYSAFQVFGIARSLPKRPITIEKNALHLNYGIMNETTIPIDCIANLEFSKRELEFDKEIRRFSPFGLSEGHNIILTVTKPCTIHGFYGIKKEFTTLAFFVNDVEWFEIMIMEGA